IVRRTRIAGLTGRIDAFAVVPSAYVNHHADRSTEDDAKIVEAERRVHRRRVAASQRQRSHIKRWSLFERCQRMPEIAVMQTAPTPGFRVRPHAHDAFSISV